MLRLIRQCSRVSFVQVEEHLVDGEVKRLLVHRKGSTRAFPPHHPLIPVDYQLTGQPVLIGGTMGTNSYVLTGERHSCRPWCVFRAAQPLNAVCCPGVHDTCCLCLFCARGANMGIGCHTRQICKFIGHLCSTCCCCSVRYRHPACMRSLHCTGCSAVDVLPLKHLEDGAPHRRSPHAW